MLCPFCKNPETKVTDKRDSEKEIRRRRECLNAKCKKRFTTYEKIEPIDIRVIKKDGSREQFSREKIRAGVMKALEKRPVETEKIDKMLSEIEEKIAKGAKGKEVESKLIGELVMSKLKKLDKVAYIRFASVYHDFKDVKDFAKEVKEVS